MKIIQFILLGIIFFSYCKNDNKSEKSKQLQQTALLLSLNQQVPPVLKLKEVNIEPTANLGNTQIVKVKLSSSSNVESVPINFYYISKEETDFLINSGVTTLDLDNNSTVKSFIATPDSISVVSAGEKEYTLALTFPSIDSNGNTISSGNYYMVPKVDPIGHIQKLPDTSKIINLSTLDKTIAFSSSKATTADLVVLDFRLKEDILKFKEPISDNEKITGSSPVNATELVSGTTTLKSIAVKTYNSKLKFSLKAPDGTLLNVKVWDSDVSAFLDELVVTELKANQNLEVPFQLSMDSTIENYILNTLKTNSSNSANFKVVVTILQKDGSTDSSTDNPMPDGRTNNNTIESNYQIVLDKGIVAKCYTTSNELIAPVRSCNPESEVPEAISKKNIYSYTDYKFTGSTEYKAGVKTYFSTDFTKIDQIEGVQSLVQVQIPLTLAKRNIEFAKISAYAFSAAQPENAEEPVAGSHLKVDVKFSGAIIYTKKVKNDKEKELYSFQKTKEAFGKDGKVITIYGIPFILRAGATGSMAGNVELSFEKGIKLNFTPSFNIDCTASAGIGGTLGGYGLEAGIRANLSLLDFKLLPKFEYKTTILEKEPQANYTNCTYAGGKWTAKGCSIGLRTISTVAGFYIGYQIALPNGDLELYASYAQSEEEKKQGKKKTKKLPCLDTTELTHKIVEIQPFSQLSSRLSRTEDKNAIFKKEWSKSIVVEKP